MSNPNIKIKRENDELLLEEQKRPTIYAFTTPSLKKIKWESDSTKKGLIKVGYTERSVETRVIEQTANFEQPNRDDNYEILLSEPAIKEDGNYFTDDGPGGVFEQLIKNNITRREGETFECTIEDVKRALIEIKTDTAFDTRVVSNFKMRPEQQQAVEQTSEYFKKNIGRFNNPPSYLWNAKMRFGKTFTTYQLAKKMGWKRILVLTWVPSVENEWKSELKNHADFTDWQFIGKSETYEEIFESQPLCWFASFQDIKPHKGSSEVKRRHKPVYEIDWDCIILDEYHYGAWNEESKKFFGQLEEKFEDQTALKSKSFLHLSGTPFRALRHGEFNEDQIFSWTYIDEQKAKEEWDRKRSKDNPYAALPKMVLLTYEIPPEIRSVAEEGEFNQFSLNDFFKAEKTREGVYEFLYKDEVNKWLAHIRGEMTVPGYSRSKNTSPLPFHSTVLLSSLRHSLWLLPSVDSVHAMKQLLEEPQNSFFNEYKIIAAAGNKAGVGVQALNPVKRAIGDGFNTKTITLTYRKVTTGVTVPQWSSVFVLKDTEQAETYFQSIFRVQNPWVVKGKNLEDEIIKEICYVYDFSPNRAFSLIEQYGSQLDRNNRKAEERIKELLYFFPVLQYSNYTMHQIDTNEILDIAATGVGSSMLARRWQDPRLVRTDNETLRMLMNNKEVLEALNKIEAFRNLNKDLSKIVAKEDSLTKTKKKRDLSKTEEKEDKEVKKFKEDYRDKLVMLLTKIPVFMYLTDEREETLLNVIEHIETTLFEEVTGITLSVFKMMCDMGAFNSAMMDSCVFSFRRFEIDSLGYVGGSKELSEIGGWSTKRKSEEVFETNQQ